MGRSVMDLIPQSIVHITGYLDDIVIAGENLIITDHVLVWCKNYHCKMLIRSELGDLRRGKNVISYFMYLRFISKMAYLIPLDWLNKLVIFLR